LDQCLRPAAVLARADRAKALSGAGIPEPLSRSIADLAALSSAPDIVLNVQKTGKPVRTVASAHFGSDDALGIGALNAIAASAASIAKLTVAAGLLDDLAR
jgi:glutamate dehydrogenase